MTRKKTYRELKERIKDLERLYEMYKWNTEHYKTLFEAAVSELEFEKMKVSYLYQVLDEVHVLTQKEDVLIAAIIENAKNRHNLDKLIHTRVLFGKNPVWFQKNAGSAEKKKSSKTSQKWQ